MMDSLLRSLKNIVDISAIVKFVRDHPILIGCTTAGIAYGACYCSRPRNLPPGPWGYPVVGSLFSLAPTPDMGCDELAKKYGDVFCLWMGENRYWIILNNYKAIKEAYITRGADFVDREAEMMVEVFGIKDTIINARYDEKYKTTRKFVAQAFRILITGKLEQYLEAEVEQVYRVINQTPGKPLDLGRHIKRLLSNCILQLLLSQRYQHGEKELDQFSDDIRTWGLGLMEVFEGFNVPYIVRKLFMSKILDKAKVFTDSLIALIQKHIEERLESPHSEEIMDILDAYLQNNKQGTYTREEVAFSILMFTADAVNGLYDMAMWVILYLVNNADYQGRIYREIQAIQGADYVSIKKRSEMPVTEAFITEVFRVVTPFEFGTPSKPLQSTIFRGFNIPEHATIFAHYGNVHRDPSLFPGPERFNPDRFIQDGKFVSGEGLVPFGMGRRMCIGEQYVKTVLFYITANLVRQYRMQSPDGAPLSTEKSEESTVTPCTKPYSVVFEKR